MDIDQLNQILRLVREHELSELEIEHYGLKLRVRKGAAAGVAVVPAEGLAPAAVVVPAGGNGRAGGAVAPGGASGPASVTPAAGADHEDEIELAVVKSPIVGTFYRSPEPGAPPFVDVGSAIKKGQVLCVIEAMKLMNEIDAECDGEIVNVYVENGQPVQYGERLFAIKTK